MYRVLCDDIPIFDPRDEELVLINPVVKPELNASGSFEFKIPPAHPQYGVPVRMLSTVQVFQDDVELFNGRIVEDSTDFYNRRTCYCEGQLAYLNDSIQRPAEYHDMTVRGYLETLISIHNEQMKEVKVAVKFNEECAGESERYDNLSLYYVQDGVTYVVLNKVRANTVAGQTYVLPSPEVYVYWHTDNSVNSFYGFSVDSIRLTDAGSPMYGTAATLPNYTATTVSDPTAITSEHNPYANKSNLLFKYTVNVPANYQSRKMFKVGMVTVVDNNDSLYRYTNYENTLTAIKEDLIENLGGYIRVRNENGVHYIDYLAEPSDNVNTQQIDFGENLLDISRGFNLRDICTAIIPLGASLEERTIAALDERVNIKSVNNGLDYIVNTEAVAKYGLILKTVKWDDVTTPEMLLSKAKKYLTDYQFDNMTIEAKAVDLHLTDAEMEMFKIGDSIHVRSPLHGIDRNFPLTGMKINLTKPSENEIILNGTQKSTLTSKSSTQSSDVVRISDHIPVPSQIVKQAIDQATALITAATHGHVVTTANEQLVMDTDDVETAQKVWRWNLNGLGYSSTGYNGTYGLAITMDGQIVGERLVAGSVSAEKLSITYRETVEREIADAEANARSDAETYTDGELKKYYTKSEVETSIQNTRDAVLLSAKETAEQYVDGKLKSYSTSAQIKVTTDAITSEVKKKLNTSDFSTKVQQSASSVQIAWNNISKYVEFSGGALKIFDTAVEASHKMVAQYNSNGSHFYRDGVYLGKIGTNSFQNKPTCRGLVFDLEYTTGYMAWSRKTSSTASVYTTMFTYYSDDTISQKGFHFGDYVYFGGYFRINDGAGFYSYSGNSIKLWAEGGVSLGDKSTSCCQFTGSEFKIWNKKSIDFYSTLNLHGWGYTNDSDARMKKNIEETAVNGLDIINGIDLKSFDWVTSGEHETIGIIAQQIQEKAPELVEQCADGHLQLKADKLVYYCIKAVQELCEHLHMGYDVPVWSDPFTLLDKKTFCAKLESGKETKETPLPDEPIVIPNNNVMRG